MGDRLRFGPLVRAHREFHRMSLSEVAKLAGTTKSHVWELENERSNNPSIIILHGLSKALSIPPHDIIDACFRTVTHDPL